MTDETPPRPRARAKTMIGMRWDDRAGRAVTPPIPGQWDDETAFPVQPPPDEPIDLRNLPDEEGDVPALRPLMRKVVAKALVKLARYLERE